MCPTITVGSFFRHERSAFLFFCSTTSNLNNSNLRSASKTKRKKQNRRPQPRKHTKDPTLAPLFFGTMRLFLKFFGLHQRVPPSFGSIFCKTMDVKKSQRVPLTFFGTVKLFKNLIKNFFGKFFHVSKGSPFNFLKFLATSWSFTKPEGSPF